MKLNVYSVFDLKAAVYGLPFFTSNDATAVRSLSNWVKDQTTMICHHPEDFILHAVGEFDDATGVIVGSTPRVIVTAASLVKYDKEIIS